jgi:hypothetical protein
MIVAYITVAICLDLIDSLRNIITERERERETHTHIYIYTDIYYTQYYNVFFLFHKFHTLIHSSTCPTVAAAPESKHPSSNIFQRATCGIVQILPMQLVYSK